MVRSIGGIIQGIHLRKLSFSKPHFFSHRLHPITFQIYQEVSDGAESPHKAELLSAIKNTIQSDLEKYPSWISLQKSVPAGKIASSSSDMKMFLRHIAFPHVLQSYDKIINEICPTSVSEGAASSAASELEGSVASATSSMDTTNNSNNSNNSVRTRAAASTLSVPMHTAPICTQPGSVETAVEDFFRGLSKGNGGKKCFLDPFPFIFS